jgi:CIC family chloride channel protein
MLRRLSDALSISPRGTAAFVALAALVGLVVGLAAAALIGAIRGFEHLVEQVSDATGAEPVVLLLAVPVGLLGAWLISRRAPEVAADGVPEAMAAIGIRSGYLPTRSAPLKIAATSLTVGLGGSVGREGPIVQIGAAIGSSLGRYTGLGEDRVRSLVAAGAGAAIGASFNAPIAGMLFAMEVILGNFAVRHLNAVVVASVTAAVTTRSLVGEELILRAFRHRLQDPRELLLYAVLGLLAVVVAFVFLRALAVNEQVRKAPGPPWLRPVVLGLSVGAIGLLEPKVLGTGQEVVAEWLNLVTSSSIVWYTLAGVLGLKLVAATLTLGAGGFGGVFMPSLFMGAALGAAFADLLRPAWGFSSLEPGSFAIVGMAATFAAVARAPLTSILIVFEITGDYGLVLPLMLAASLATFMGDLVHPDSVYQAVLARQGIRLTRRSEVDVLDTVTVGEVASPVTAVVSPGDTTAEVQGLLDRTRHHGVPVVEDGRLVGVITVTDIVRAGGPSDLVTARDAMTPKPVTATPQATVAEVLQRMASLGVGRVPVVAEDDPGELVAVFRREDAVTAYHVALGQEVHHDIGRDRLRARTQPGAGFFDVEVPGGSAADGAPVKELPIPGGCTIVAVRRGTVVMVPDGSTRLAAGDVLTVFAREGSKEQFEARLGIGDTAEMAAVAGDDPARFFDLEVPAGSVADGRVIREVPVPGGCTIVSVRRDAEVIVPDGSTRLRAGDVLTVFARWESRTQFAERLRVGSEPG